MSLSRLHILPLMVCEIQQGRVITKAQPDTNTSATTVPAQCKATYVPNTVLKNVQFYRQQANGKLTSRLNTVRIKFLRVHPFVARQATIKDELKLLQNKSVIQNKLSIEQLILYNRLILYHPEILTKFCALFCNIKSTERNKSAK